jgi:hypothetical protein
MDEGSSARLIQKDFSKFAGKKETAPNQQDQSQKPLWCDPAVSRAVSALSVK